MKRIGMIAVACMLLLSLLGCTLLGCNGSNHYYGERTDLYRVALYSIPIELGVASNPPVIDEKKVEIDSYGRSLYYVLFHKQGFYYALPEYASQGWLVAAFVMQKCDDEKLYFYEDRCFLIDHAERTGLSDYTYSFDPERMNDFLNRNDWNQPLNLDRCSTRQYSKDAKDYLGMDVVHNSKLVVIRDGLEAYTGKKVDVTGTESAIAMLEDGNHNLLYYVEYRENKSAQTESYFIVVNANAESIASENILKVDTLDFGEQLHQFKMRNGWDFTTCPGETDKAAG